jgi:hypothetical protein
MGLYDQFSTDKDIEINGVKVDFGDFRVRIARAGGHNQKWAKIVEAKSRPFKTAIQANALSNEKATQLMAEIYAEAVVKGWETLVGDEWQDGIEGPDGDLLPCTQENVKVTLTALPDLFALIQQHAQDLAVFRDASLAEDAKN